jgi:hypothetical protein
MIYPDLDGIEVIKLMREGAAVQRCHTVPTINEYSNGHHTYNMLAMLRHLWPEAPIALVWAIVDHDQPERLTGDIPAPSKWFGIVDREKLDEFEHWFALHVHGFDFMDMLDEDLLAWFRGLDIIELYMFGRDQMHMGNRNFEVMTDRIVRYIHDNPSLIAPPLLDLFWEAKDHDWSMMPDLGDFR